jgi:hypothetical protein
VTGRPLSVSSLSPAARSDGRRRRAAVAPGVTVTVGPWTQLPVPAACLSRPARAGPICGARPGTLRLGVISQARGAPGWVLLLAVNRPGELQVDPMAAAHHDGDSHIIMISDHNSSSSVARPRSRPGAESRPSEPLYACQWN